jgi:hypothetical protein
VGGVLELALEATSEAQDINVDFGDVLPFRMDQNLIWEARVAFSAITASNNAVWGIASELNADPDTVAESAWFRIDGTTALKVETDDGTTNTDDTAAGTIEADGTYHIYRIDCTDLTTSVKFYLDNVRVAAATAHPFAATGADAAVQPYFHLNKAANTSTLTMLIDYVRVWMDRSW